MRHPEVKDPGVTLTDNYFMIT